MYTNSFSEDTTVVTSDGDVPISELEVGDTVIAYDETTGETGEYEITDTISHEDPIIVHLTIDGELIKTTPEHPFYTDEGEWINASDLEVGELIYSLEGEFGAVEAVVFVADLQTMYNLTVDEAHTFFVGDGEWLVHNSCDISRAQKSLVGKNSPFTKHPSTSGRCDACANEAGVIIRDMYPEYQVDIIRLQNEVIPGGTRGAMMRVRDKNNQLFTIAEDPIEKQPFHEVVRIQNDGEAYIMDALVYERQGLNPMPFEEYLNLWEYPDGIEITRVRPVP
jgi:hypothetical protein